MALNYRDILGGESLPGLAGQAGDLLHRAGGAYKRFVGDQIGGARLGLQKGQAALDQYVTLPALTFADRATGGGLGSLNDSIEGLVGGGDKTTTPATAHPYDAEAIQRSFQEAQERRQRGTTNLPDLEPAGPPESQIKSDLSAKRERDARSAELKAGGYTEFAPGQGYKGPALKGGGTVSMMTAPENASHVTFASQMEDAQEKAALAQLQQRYQDPYGLKKAQALADIEGQKELAKPGAFIATLGESDRRLDAETAAKLQELHSNPKFAQLSPEDRAKAEAEVVSATEKKRTRFREDFGLSTGQGAGLFKRDPVGELPPAS